MTLYEKLIAAGLPIASATETGEITGIPGVVMTSEQLQLQRDICLEYFKPLEYADLLAVRADRQTLKDQYQAAVDRLQQIENATNPTNAQVIQAVKDIAHYERIILKVLARLLT